MFKRKRIERYFFLRNSQKILRRFRYKRFFDQKTWSIQFTTYLSRCFGYFFIKFHEQLSTISGDFLFSKYAYYWNTQLFWPSDCQLLSLFLHVYTFLRKTYTFLSILTVQRSIQCSICCKFGTISQEIPIRTSFYP